MGAFRFRNSQCVQVPGAGGAWGRVSGRSDFVGGPRTYWITWLDPQMRVRSEVFGEAQLIEANPPVYVCEPAARGKRKARKIRKGRRQ